MTAEPPELAALAGVPTGYLTDAMRRLGLVGWAAGIGPVSGRRQVAGRAVTLRYGPATARGPAVPSPYQVIYELARPGDVLVVAGQGTRSWLLGGNQATAAMMQGLAGIVVDGCVRDLAELATLDLAVFAAGASTRPYSPDLDLVAVDVPVRIGGMTVHPGDVIVGDEDGLLSFPYEQLDELLFQATEIAEIEQAQADAIRQRAPLAEVRRISAQKKRPRQHPPSTPLA
jgi:4-hydroxy-4-methyl-2-oxoglutarate aldolase